MPPASHAPPRRRRRRAIGLTALLAVIGVTLGVIAAVDPAPQPIPGSYVSSGHTVWRYLDDDTDPAEGAADPGAWTEAGFDDSAWSEGEGGFGARRGERDDLGRHSIRTLLEQYTDEEENVRTFFFRSTFELEPEEFERLRGLQAEVIHDDALVLYVNGERARGFEDAELEQNRQYAGEGHSDPREQQFGIDPELLRAGVNQLAVSLHQSRASSSDVYFDMLSLLPVFADDALEIGDVHLGVGAAESERRVSWSSNSGEDEAVQLTESSQLGPQGAFPDDADLISTRRSESEGGIAHHHARLEDLEPGTEYAYRIGSEERGWSEAWTFRTGAASDEYGFLLLGDAQLGASGDLTADARGWASTLDIAERTYPDAAFLYSLGDQVEFAGREDQYAEFFRPEPLRPLPLAALIGNHDVESPGFHRHFDVPNLDTEYGSAPQGHSGGNYWYRYGEVLFIALNSNSEDHDSHAEYLRRIVSAEQDEARWTVVGFHHSIHSVARHADSETTAELNEALSPVLSELDVDLALMGHDHSYARSHLMDDDNPRAQSGSVLRPHPGEVLYITANSSSGSKYYPIVNDDKADIAVRNQEEAPNFSHVQVSPEALTVTTHRSEDASVVDQITLRR